MAKVRPITLVCWNIEHKSEPWRVLRGMEADVALLQETRPPPSDAGIAAHDVNDPGDRPKGRLNGRAVTVRLNDRVEVEFIDRSFATDPSVLAAARIQVPNAEAFVVVSIAPAFEYPHEAVLGSRATGHVGTDCQGSLASDRATPNDISR